MLNTKNYLGLEAITPEEWDLNGQEARKSLVRAIKNRENSNIIVPAIAFLWSSTF